MRSWHGAKFAFLFFAPRIGLLPAALLLVVSTGVFREGSVTQIVQFLKVRRQGFQIAKLRALRPGERFLAQMSLPAPYQALLRNTTNRWLALAAFRTAFAEGAALTDRLLRSLPESGVTPELQVLLEDVLRLAARARRGQGDTVAVAALPDPTVSVASPRSTDSRLPTEVIEIDAAALRRGEPIIDAELVEEPVTGHG